MPEDDTQALLEALGLARYAGLFAEHQIDADVLPDLTEADLEKIGLPLGARKKLLRAIATRRQTEALPQWMRGAQRRQLTVLFCDLVGSTELAIGLDPEDLQDLYIAYQDRVSEAVTRFGGHVAKFMGDGVLVYFGWPDAREDACEMAIRAALATGAAVRALPPPHDGQPLACRIGIATGLVVVGARIGQGGAAEESVVGEAPNLAARLQQEAEPDSIVIDGTTRRQVGNLFECRDLGAAMLRGFSTPVQCWQVLGESTGASRFRALRGTSLTPLVGRTAELEALSACWQSALRCEGRIVTLRGEPGIGKSRLIEALLGTIVGHPHERLRYFCSPHHVNSAFHPLLDQIRRSVRIADSDPPETRLDRLEQLFRPLGQGPEAVPLVATLLSVPLGPRYPEPNLMPEVFKARVLDALLATSLAAARTRPLVVALEDAHWLDPSSGEVFAALAERVAGLPILFVISLRDDSPTEWLPRRPDLALELERLDPEAGRAIIRALSGDRPIPAALEDEILARTEGVPLFVEELTRAIAERDDTDPAGTTPFPAVPATLSDSLMARLDRHPGAKEIAQIGAVIGRSFDRATLLAIAPAGKETVDAGLARLVESGLLKESDAPGGPVYRFKHAFIQDAAYESLLRRTRQALHGSLAAWLRNRPGVEPELIAHHLTEARETTAAIDAWVAAGQQAAHRSAGAEAISHFERALGLIALLPNDTERDRRELAVLTPLGSSLIEVRGAGAPEIAQHYGRARSLCRRLGADHGLAPVLQGLRLHWQERGDLGTAAATAAMLIEIAAGTGNPAIEREACRAAGVVAYFRGANAVARQHLERGIFLSGGAPGAGPEAMRSENDTCMTCLAYAGRTLWALGHADQAVARVDRAVRIARSIGHMPSVVEAMIWRAEIALFRGEPRVALHFAGPALEAAADYDLPLWRGLAAVLVGRARCGLGDFAGGLELMREGAEKHDPVTARLLLFYCRAMYAEALAEAGRGDEALALSEAITAALPDGYLAAPMLALQGEILALRGPSARDAAEARLSASLRLAEAQDAQAHRLRAVTGLARLLAEAGERGAAGALLDDCLRDQTEGSTTVPLRAALGLLSSLREAAISIPPAQGA